MERYTASDRFAIWWVLYLLFPSYLEKNSEKNAKKFMQYFTLKDIQGGPDLKQLIHKLMANNIIFKENTKIDQREDIENKQVILNSDGLKLSPLPV